MHFFLFCFGILCLIGFFGFACVFLGYGWGINWVERIWKELQEREAYNENIMINVYLVKSF